MAKCFNSATQALYWLYVFSHLLCDVTKALFTHTTQSFPVNGLFLQFSANKFFNLYQNFSSVNNFKDAVEKILEAYDFL